MKSNNVRIINICFCFGFIGSTLCNRIHGKRYDRSTALYREKISPPDDAEDNSSTEIFGFFLLMEVYKKTE